MLTTKKFYQRTGGIVASLLLIVALSGCTPNGPRALEQGEQLMEKGEYAAAVRKFRLATSKLPDSPQAWNHLGLAYHRLGDTNNALAAYQKAVNLDASHAPVYFNLGTLYEQTGNSTEAIRAFVTYVGFETNSFSGWFKLGSLQRRDSRTDEARRSFERALAITPDDPRALNELGLVQRELMRSDEALRSFERAVQLDPTYAPALLNLAIVSHQSTTNLTYALERYRQYVNLEPAPANAADVRPIIQQLENQIASQNEAAAESARIAEQERLEAERLAEEEQQAELARQVEAERRAEEERLAQEAAAAEAAALAAQQEEERLAAEAAAAEEMANTETSDTSVIEIENSGTEVAETSEDSGNPDLISVEEGTTTPATENTAQQTLPRRTQLPPGVTPLEPVTREPDGESRPSNTFAGPLPEGAPSARTPTARTEVAFPRYAYRELSASESGNRPSAEPFFVAGSRAQSRNQYRNAITEYRSAIGWDPTYFDAYYNMGLSALAITNYPVALDSFERALTLQPESDSARFNFALSLQRANYPLDAVQEFRKVENVRPDDPRVHLALGNLYAQVLNQPALAREHYQKVLEIMPAHSQSTAIRYWLQRNPATE